MRYFKNIHLIAIGAVMMVGTANADIVHNDDVIITFSQCVGNDCVSGESFGFDTVRLKENNLRIKFQDTSTTASFPRRDWQITVNDSSNGGAEKFSIDDIDGGRTPFTIEAGAPSHSLYVDDGGRLGLGTSTPVVDVHVVSGNTPTLRLEQDGSSGFTPQTWDVAGNESNFFIRDVTNGSKLAFKIKPGAPTGSIFVKADGDIGMGTESPDAALHVSESTGGAASMLQLTNNAGMFVTFENTGTNDDWFITAENANEGDFIIDSAIEGAGDGPEFTLAPNGDLLLAGMLTTTGVGACNSGCDAVFNADYDLPTIEEHANYMFENRHLEAVGPTSPAEPFNVTEKVGGVLNELEKAHIYIVQLNERLAKLEAALAEKD